MHSILRFLNNLWRNKQTRRAIIIIITIALVHYFITAIASITTPDINLPPTALEVLIILGYLTLFPLWQMLYALFPQIAYKLGAIGLYSLLYATALYFICGRIARGWRRRHPRSEQVND